MNNCKVIQSVTVQEDAIMIEVGHGDLFHSLMTIQYQALELMVIFWKLKIVWNKQNKKVVKNGPFKEDLTENSFYLMKILSSNLHKLKTMVMLIKKDIGLHFVIHQDGAENHNQLVYQDFAHQLDIVVKNGQKDGENLHLLQFNIPVEK